MKCPLAALGLLLICSTQTFAQTYHVEVSADYSELHGTFGDDPDLSIVRAEYYFSPVSTTSGPFAESSFLAKSSSVFGSYSDGLDIFRLTNEGDGYAVGGRLIGDDGKYILGLRLENMDIDGRSYSYSSNSGSQVHKFTMDQESLGLEIGSYVSDNARVLFTYSDSELDAPQGVIREDDRYQISYKQLFETAEDTYANLEVKVDYWDLKSISRSGDSKHSHGDEMAVLEVVFDYYFSRQLALGLVLGDLEYKSFFYGLNTEFFVSPAVGLSAAYDVIDSTSGGGKLETFSIALRGRF